jgi:hypothetical protein
VGQRLNLDSQNVYEIAVRGEINGSWLAGFGARVTETELTVGGHQATLLKIVTDQAGLVGLIRQLHRLGVVLLSIRQAPEAD